ncbi:MAG: cation transporter [Candidatus Endonucleobacter bathymodioli]|uniref:Cation transporter n=1 Tax=Candidatus Endonucleibacter bathymodioli TaxID=539814 RepID=A0AA90NW00_9GAMM|nr:cation transporter [Candidatus Endonucleobacter bathymodioli]
MSGCGCEIEIKNKEESRMLIILLSINAAMFFIEITLGITSESTALIADSLDMLADATVYGIGLYAVGKEAIIKIKTAHISGVFQVLLGVIVFIDIVRRTVLGSEPESMLIIFVGIAALIANLICLQLISKHKDGEVHMRASWVFSKNDVIANLGIILAGILVYQFNSRFPDLIIGLVISIIVIRGGLHIIKDAKNEKIKMQI